MRCWRWLPVLLLGLALGNAVAQSPAIANSVVPVGLLVIQPTRLPQSLQQFEGQDVFLPIAYGTGFVVSEDGYVVTALHVVRKAQSRLPEIQASGKQLVVCLNQPVQPYECKAVELVSTDDGNDLAILKIKSQKTTETLRALPLTPERPMQDTEVWAAGYPEREAGKLVVASGRFASGNLASDNRLDGDAANNPSRTLWFATMTAESGESGAPVYLRDGSVIGMVVTRSDTQAITGFVPARHVIDLLARSGVLNQAANNPPRVVAGP